MKTILCDLDGVLCNTPCVNGQNKYELSTPINENIERLNKRFESGDTVIIWTARGKNSGIDWRELTEIQLSKWGVKYIELDIGSKRHFDIILDDKFIKIEEL